MKGLKDAAISFGYRTINWCMDHSAEICTAVAMIASAGAVVATVKATNDVRPELEHHKKNIETIKEHKAEDKYYHDELVDNNSMEIETVLLTGEEAEKQYKRDLTKEYLSTGVTVGKYYIVPVTLEALALITMFTSNKISRKKNAALTGSLTVLQAAYDKYRRNVIDAVGEEKERDIRLGLYNDKISEEETDENGKTKKVKKDVKVVNPDKLSDPFSYIYDEKADNFNKSKGCNRQALMIRQAYWNDYLVRHKRVFVNDVLKDIGLESECTPLGQCYGWIYDDSAESTRQNCIRFNIEDDARFMGNYDPSVIITLTPDGNILEDAFINKPIVTKKAWAGASY